MVLGQLMGGDLSDVRLKLQLSLQNDVHIYSVVASRHVVTRLQRQLLQCRRITTRLELQRHPHRAVEVDRPDAPPCRASSAAASSLSRSCTAVESAARLVVSPGSLDRSYSSSCRGGMFG